MESETLEHMQARHRKELKDLQGRITSKKKNASKKTRKGVNDECAQMEAQLREKQAAEVQALNGPTSEGNHVDEFDNEQDEQGDINGAAKLQEKLGDKLEHAVERLHVSKSPSPATDTAAGQGEAPEAPVGGGGGGSGGGKKKNRQKERLARRAAEQEAAAQKAEEEASNMTDHRARESEYMDKMFKTHDLVEKQINPDGHCLFSAVADQLGQQAVSLGAAGEPPYKIVRTAAATYMVENADDFAPFLEEDLHNYATKIRDTAEWGGQLELMALARRYGVEIRVIQDGRMEKIGEEEGKATGKVLWLAYYRHGYGLGEHYNSLRKAK
jgi:OTU domain-containing protein 6